MILGQINIEADRMVLIWDFVPNGKNDKIMVLNFEEMRRICFNYPWWNKLETLRNIILWPVLIFLGADAQPTVTVEIEVIKNNGQKELFDFRFGSVKDAKEMEEKLQKKIHKQ